MAKGLLSRIVSLLFLCLVLLSIQPGMALAYSDEAIHSFTSQTPFYDATKRGGCFGGQSVPLSVNLPEPIITGINANKDVYEAVAQEKNVPWQLIAALHYRETNLNSTQNPANGQGIYQLYSLYQAGQTFPPGPIDKAEFQRQTGLAVDFFLGKQSINLPSHQARITADNPDPDTIKDTFYSYNGRSSAYAKNAASYGFDPATQPYEGSPYVMNKFDTARQNMPIITSDGGGVDGTDTREGAFTLYAALSGIQAGGCSGASGSRIADIAKAELDKDVHETPDGCNCGGQIDKYTDNHPEYWCADFVSWVYNEAGSPFTDGWNGWRISYVPGLVMWLKTHGEYTERAENRFAPAPGDVIILTGSASTDSSGDEGHTGIVYEVNGDSITTIEGNANNAVLKLTYNNYKTDFKITGWGRQR